jgi:flavin-binding protein dodecin
VSFDSESCAKLGGGTSSKGAVMSVTKIIEVVGRSTVSSDDAVKSALAEASRSLRSVKALDVVSIGLRGDNLDEWGALVRISFLVENVTD